MRRAVIALVCLGMGSTSRGDVGTASAVDLQARARASLAKISGTTRVRGLAKPVVVRRDRNGIPHVKAATVDDLFFAQGFVQAQDRLFQMELWRRSTQGRLAEFLGPKWIDRDRVTRLVTRYRGDMAVEWASYDPQARQICESFVRGINAYVDFLGKKRPLEFELAGMALEHWKAEDLLARAEAFGMSGNARREVERATALGELGQEVFFALSPLEPEATPLIPPGFDPKALPAGLGAALALIGGAAQVASDDDGSNNWVLAGTRTSTGAPLLANDPHRALDHPSLRYLVHLEAPGWNVIGAVVPWFPGVAIGHNEHVAWGLTIFRVDAQDLFVEDLDPSDPLRYKTPSGWDRMSSTTETIEVKGASPVTVELKYTRHGPVVYEDLSTHRAFALRWTGSEPGTAGYLAALALNRARNGASFREAARRWKMPGENFVWADKQGNVGYQATGLTPIRKPGTGLVPAPGASGELDWQGFLDPDELPSITNPAEGFVATANHNTMGRTYRHPIGYEWSPRFRIDRIEEVLRSRRRHSLNDLTALQQDILSGPARSLAGAIASVEGGGPSVAAMTSLLRGWDHRIDKDSAAAAAFAVFYDKLQAAYAASRLPPGVAASSSITRLVSAEAMVKDIAAKPPTDILRMALHDAHAELVAKLGADASKW
jgi:penicillin G amidase